MDKLTPSQRSWVMSRIKSKETTPERAVRSALHRFGFRFLKNDSRLPGSPDIVFPHYHAVIFVNGCFWHYHEGCKSMRLPKTNVDFWRTKLERNRIRDKKEIDQLISDGWRVGVVWECSITGKNRPLKIKSISEKISYWLEESFEESFIEI